MNNEKKYLFDDPKNIKRILHILYACCALLVVLDFVIHRHVMHSWETLWGFYPIYGFVGCVILVVVATWMRTFLMRDEDYYDKEEVSNLNETNEKSEMLADQSTSKTGGQNVVD